MSFGSSGRFQRRRGSEYIDHERGSVYSTDAAGRNYEPGTGAEYMARSGWVSNNGPYTRNAFSTDERQITFNKRSSSKTALIVALIVTGFLLTVLIIAIVVLLALKVFVLNPQDKEQSKVATSTYWPTSTFPPMISILPPIASTFSESVRPPTFSPLTPSSLPPPILPPVIEQFVKRHFIGDMYILQQANPAYNDKSHFEYTQATQMILSALKSMFDGSTLRPYLTNISIASLENSDSNLLVQFNIDLYMPSQSGIDAAVVQNVILSNLPQLEEQLNGVQIDRNVLSVVQA